MKIWVGIKLRDKNTIDAIKNDMDNVRSVSDEKELTAENNLHVTLIYMGAATDMEYGKTVEELKTVSFSRFSLSLGRIGTFTRRDGSAVYRRQVNLSRELAELQRSVSDAVSRAWFTPNEKKYFPHITLSRGTVCSREFMEEVNRKAVSSSFSVNKFTLFESIRNKNEVIYREIMSFPAKDFNGGKNV